MSNAYIGYCQEDKISFLGSLKIFPNITLFHEEFGVMGYSGFGVIFKC